MDPSRNRALLNLCCCVGMSAIGFCVRSWACEPGFAMLRQQEYSADLSLSKAASVRIATIDVNSDGVAVFGDDGLPRLSGIVAAGDIRRAIFESGGTPSAYGVGDQVGSYRIVAITPRVVTIDGPGGRRFLHPSEDAAALQTEPAPPSLLEKLHTQSPPTVPVPRPPSLTQMLSRLPHAR